MKEYLTTTRATNITLALSSDDVHLDAFGHWLMAESILLQLGVSDAAKAGNAEDLLAKFSHDQEILLHEKQEQAVWKDAWLSAIGHKRLGTKHGLPIESIR